MVVQQHVAASIFDINSRARTAALVCLAALATVLTVVSTGQAQTFTVLHTFSGSDGDLPFAGLTMDRAGNFYGTTYQGGAAGFGNVFKLSHEGSGWVLSNLYSFQGGSDGEHPQARVVFGPDGTLYGTTTNGGNGYGTVFNLRPPAAICRAIQCPWTETVIYRFNGTDGGYPQFGDLTFDAASNIYGTTAYGGDLSCNRGEGCGVVFKLSRSGGGWTESVLYAFPGSPESGSEPFSGVTFDSAGNLFGTTFLATSTVYELTPSGSGWTQTILHSLSIDDGDYPIGGVAFDQQGNLYGTTVYGAGQSGVGTVFQLQPSGGNWNFNLLYTWGSGPGPGPYDTPTLDVAGNVYSPTSGGYTGVGGVFKLEPGANGWTYTDLYDFGDPHLSDGFIPLGGVVLDGNGNLYGTTAEGGNFNPPCGEGCGVVWEITP